MINRKKLWILLHKNKIIENFSVVVTKAFSFIGAMQNKKEPVLSEAIDKSCEHFAVTY
ncbi:MAG: hypothetical protein HUJ86_07945 [Synergistes sp.]|nr:hypothetical protein [Synergistes sp.]